MKKVIFLDWHNTLSYSLFWDALAKEHPAYYKSVIFEIFSNQTLINDWMKGKVTSEVICKILSLNNFYSYDFIFKELIKSTKSMSFVSSEIPSLVKQLKNKGLKVVIATDNMDTFRRYTIKSMHLDTLFDDFLISYELKALKYEVVEGKLPFFQDYLEKNNLTYKEVILLDDSIDLSGNVEKIGLPVLQIKDTKHLLESLKNFL